MIVLNFACTVAAIEAQQGTCQPAPHLPNTAPSIPPAPPQCRAEYEKLGPTGLLLKLAPCQAGVSDACCTAAKGLAKIGEGGPLAGCLCNIQFALSAQVRGKPECRLKLV